MIQLFATILLRKTSKVSLPPTALIFFLFFASFFLAAFLCHIVPFYLYLRNVPALTKKEFLARYSSKAPSVLFWGGASFLFFSLLSIFLIIYQSRNLFMCQTEIIVAGILLLFPTFAAGANLSAALIEISAGVSIFIPLRLGIGGGESGETRYFVSPRARLVGMYRLLLAIIFFTAFHILAHWEGE